MRARVTLYGVIYRDRPPGAPKHGSCYAFAMPEHTSAEPGALLWTLDEIGRLVSHSGNASETLTNIVELIQATIARLNRELGLTIVLVEQNVAFARAASRHFVIIETGMVAAQGPISALTDEVVHRHMTV